VAVGTVFLRRQLRLRMPMLPIDLLMQRPVFALSSGTAVCAHAAAIMAMVTLPFYFQYAGGLTAIQVGTLMTPWPVAVVVMAPIAGGWPNRFSAGVLGGLGLLLIGSGAGDRGPGAADRRLAGHRLAAGAVRDRLRLLPVAQQPAIAGQRAGGPGGGGQRDVVDITAGGADDRIGHRDGGDGADPCGAEAIVRATHISIGIAAGSALLAMALSWLRVVRR